MEDGAKNQTAAGRYEEIRGRAAERSAPQFMNPRPIGSVPFVLVRLAFLSRSWALDR